MHELVRDAPYVRGIEISTKYKAFLRNGMIKDGSRSSSFKQYKSTSVFFSPVKILHSRPESY